MQSWGVQLRAELGQVSRVSLSGQGLWEGLAEGTAWAKARRLEDLGRLCSAGAKIPAGERQTGCLGVQRPAHPPQTLPVPQILREHPQVSRSRRLDSRWHPAPEARQPCPQPAGHLHRSCAQPHGEPAALAPPCGQVTRPPLSPLLHPVLFPAPLSSCCPSERPFFSQRPLPLHSCSPCVPPHCSHLLPARLLAVGCWGDKAE